MDNRNKPSRQHVLWFGVVIIGDALDLCIDA